MSKKSPRLPRYHTFEQWKFFIEEWKESGLSVTQYCKKRDLTHSAFSKWFKKVTGSSVYSSSYQSSKLMSLPPLLEINESGLESESEVKKSKDRVAVEKWKELIIDWQQSGLNLSSYCNQNNLSHTSLRDWLYKFYPSLKTKKKSSSIRKKKPRPPHYRTREEWKKIIEDWQQSGLSKAAYCQKYNIGATAFMNWAQRFMGLDLYQQMIQKTQPPIFTLEEWKKIFKEWKQSGLGKEKFCIKKGISITSFCRWEEKLKSLKIPNLPQDKLLIQTSNSKSSLQNLFIPITLKPEPAPVTSSEESSKVEVTLSGGHKLLIQGTFDWDNVMTLLTPLLT